MGYYKHTVWGMAVQSLTTAYLLEFVPNTVSSGQQLIVGLLFLIIVLILIVADRLKKK